MKTTLGLMLFLVLLVGNAWAGTPALTNRTGTRVYIEVSGPPSNATTEYIVSGGEYYMRRVDPATYEPIQNDSANTGLAWSGVSTALNYDYYMAEWEWISDSVMWGMDSDNDCYSDMMEAIYASDAFDANNVPHPFFGVRTVMKHGVLTDLNSGIPDAGSCGGSGGDNGGSDDSGGNGGNTGGNTGDGGNDPGDDSDADVRKPQNDSRAYDESRVVGENGEVISYAEYFQSLIDDGVIKHLVTPDDVYLFYGHMYPIYLGVVQTYEQKRRLQQEKENWNWSEEMAASVKMYSEEEMAKLDAEIAAMERAVAEQEAANSKLTEIGSSMNAINDNLGSGGAISTQVQKSSNETNANLSRIESGIGALNQKAVTANTRLTEIKTGVDNIGDNLEATKQATVKSLADIESAINENLGEDGLLDEHLEGLKIATDDMSRQIGVKLDGVVTQMQGNTAETVHELQKLGITADSQREMLEASMKEMAEQNAESIEKLLESEKAALEEMKETAQTIETGDREIVNAIESLESQTITNTDRIVGALADHDVNVTVDVNSDGVNGKLDAIIGGLGEIAKNTASGNGEEVDLGRIEGLLSGISGQIDEGLALLENGLGGKYSGYGGLDDWEKPEKTELMQFDLDLADAKSRMKAAVERVGVDFDSLNAYSASPFSTQIKIPVGGTLDNLRWYTYTFSMDKFPNEVQSGIDRFREVFLTVAKAAMSLLFGRKVWAMLWSL